MGAGSAVQTRRLSPKFKPVIIPSLGASNVGAARSYPGENSFYKFRVAKGEEAADLKPGSADLEFGANMVHYTDVDGTSRDVIHQFKSGVTISLGGSRLHILLDPGDSPPLQSHV